MINSNWWNIVRYTIYVPIYDLLTEKLFASSRKKSIEKLKIKSGEKVLLVGAGTGLDIKYIRKDASIYATDITPSMIKKIQSKYGSDIQALVMDGQNLQFPDEHFDKIVLHLILAVIPDPKACIKEVERVLKADGKIVILDKFLKNPRPGLPRRILNIFTRFIFSDINRNLTDIIHPTSLVITGEEKANFGGKFNIYTLRKEQ